MRSKSQPAISIDELMATLKRSFLPTLIVEGDDDLIVFRRMEETFSDVGISVMPVGGRSKLLQIFDRRAELPDERMIGFITDRDMWVISGVPEKYKSNRIAMTNGYSIENDIYMDGRLEDLLSQLEANKLKEELTIFTAWYAIAANRVISGKSELLDHHPNLIVDDGEMRESVMKLEAGEVYPTALRDQIHGEYKRLLRGKSLLALLMRQLSYKGRAVKHRHDALMEQVAVKRGPLLDSLHAQVGEMFVHLRKQ